MFSKPRRHVECVFVHCSDSDVPSHDNTATIRKWHVEENGWSDIGYHYFITKDGELHFCRDIERTPAAQGKKYNPGSIAICLSGRHKFTEIQFDTLRELCERIQNSYYSCIPFFEHNKVSKGKTCPNFRLCNVLDIDTKGFFKRNISKGLK